MTAILQRLGLKVKHQQWGEHGMVSWTGSNPYGKFSGEWTKDIGHDHFIIHIIRDPVKSVNSLATLAGTSWKYICSELDTIEEYQRKLYACMRFWVDWNRKCRDEADLTIRVEDIDKANIFGLGTEVGTNKDKETYGGWTREDMKSAHPSIYKEMMSLAVSLGYDAQ